MIGAVGHLGAGQGLPSTLMSTLWALPGCSRCSAGCCCGPSICCQALEAPAVEGEACRGGKSHLEPTGLAGWQGEGVVWQGSSRGLGRAGSPEPVCLGLSVSVTRLFRFVCREVTEVAAALGSQLVLVVGSGSSCQL